MHGPGDGLVAARPSNNVRHGHFGVADEFGQLRSLSPDAFCRYPGKDGRRAYEVPASEI